MGRGLEEAVSVFDVLVSDLDVLGSGLDGGASGLERCDSSGFWGAGKGAVMDDCEGSASLM